MSVSREARFTSTISIATKGAHAMYLNSDSWLLWTFGFHTLRMSIIHLSSGAQSEDQNWSRAAERAERHGGGSASRLPLISCTPGTNLRVWYRQMSYRNLCARCSTHSTTDFKRIINQMEINGTGLILWKLNRSRGCYHLMLFSVMAHASPMRIGPQPLLLSHFQMRGD